MNESNRPKLSYGNKMIISLIVAVIIGGSIASFLDIENKVRFGVLIGAGTFVLLSLFTSKSKNLLSGGSLFRSSTKLIDASMNGRIADVKNELLKGEDVNQKTKGGMTALFAATLSGDKEIVSYLLENNADVNLKGPDGLSPLVAACSEGNIDIAQLLLKRGASVNEVNKPNALMNAAYEGQLQSVKLLLANGADINATEKINGRTALMFAILNGHYEITKFLLENKANPNVMNKDGMTALMAAAMQGHRNIVEILISFGSNINASSQTGTARYSAIMFAADSKNWDIVEILLQNGKYIDNIYKNEILYKFSGQNVISQKTLSTESGKSIKSPTIGTVVETISTLDGIDNHYVILEAENSFIQAFKSAENTGFMVEYQIEDTDNQHESTEEINGDLTIKMFLRFLLEQEYIPLGKWKKIDI